VLPDWCQERAAGPDGRARAFQEPQEEDRLRLARGLASVPEPMAEQLRGYIQAADRARGLALRLLLRRAVSELPSPEGADPLDAWEQDRYGRPQVPGLPRFNATHSGRLVALAIRSRPPGTGPESDPGLGLDTEAFRSVDFRLMEHYMRPREWTDIQTHPEPQQRFFHYWTAKEALMKAEGLGFHLPLEEIELQGDAARIRGRNWFLHRPALPNALQHAYALHLACAEEDPQWRIRSWSWETLTDAQNP
jgi:4'-phosphopantetheinyl transferase